MIRNITLRRKYNFEIAVQMQRAAAVASVQRTMSLVVEQAVEYATQDSIQQADHGTDKRCMDDQHVLGS